jgi:ketosteroid isomerase-like protein
MSQQNVEVVRELYRRLDQDGRFPDALLDSEIEYVNPRDAVEPGTRRGLAAFHQAMDRVGQVWEDMERLIEKFLGNGDEVVVLLTFVVRGRGSGLEQRQPQGHVWTVQNGRATRFRWFNSQDEALEAAGLRE